MRDDLSRILLVGPGRAGRAFARSWTRAGGSVVLVAREPAAARESVRGLPRTEVVALDDSLRLSGGVVVLAVPDDAIRPLAADLAGRTASRFAFHFSGALPAAAMLPLEPGVAELGSLHPLRAFTGSAEEDWSEAFVAVEGGAAAVEAGVEIARSIGARPRRLAAADKPLYHAAATMAAGGSASLISLATRIWVEAGLDEEEGRVALAELASTAIGAVAKLPFAQALTGPLARRDRETIRLHVQSLAGRPEAARLYALLAAETLRRTAGRGQESEIAAVLEALEGIGGSGSPETAEYPDNTARKG